LDDNLEGQTSTRATPVSEPPYYSMLAYGWVESEDDLIIGSILGKT
jgi:hypothetical protein